MLTQPALETLRPRERTIAHHCVYSARPSNEAHVDVTASRLLQQSSLRSIVAYLQFLFGAQPMPHGTRLDAGQVTYVSAASPHSGRPPCGEPKR